MVLYTMESLIYAQTKFTLNRMLMNNHLPPFYMDIISFTYHYPDVGFVCK